MEMMKAASLDSGIGLAPIEVGTFQPDSQYALLAGSSVNQGS